jgi:hypothetical protein
VRSLEVEVLDKATGICARPEVIVQRRVRASATGHRLDVAAATAVDKQRLALDLAAIETQESVFRMVLLLMFAFRLHSL